MVRAVHDRSVADLFRSMNYTDAEQRRMRWDRYHLLMKHPRVRVVNRSLDDIMTGAYKNEGPMANGMLHDFDYKGQMYPVALLPPPPGTPGPPAATGGAPAKEERTKDRNAYRWPLGNFVEEGEGKARARATRARATRARARAVVSRRLLGGASVGGGVGVRRGGAVGEDVPLFLPVGGILMKEYGLDASGRPMGVMGLMSAEAKVMLRNCSCRSAFGSMADLDPTPAPVKAADDDDDDAGSEGTVPGDVSEAPEGVVPASPPEIPAGTPPRARLKKNLTHILDERDFDLVGAADRESRAGRAGKHLNKTTVRDRDGD